MEPLGWVIFVASYTIVIGLIVFCFYRVLSIPQEHMHSPLDIDTQDLDNGDNGKEENHAS